MDTLTPRRILIVDDHPIVRKGLRRLIERNDCLTVIGEAGSGDEALEQIGERRPDLAIVDIAMDQMDGLELTGYLKRDYPDVEVLILSMHDDSQYVERALELGAKGYVLKDNVSGVIEYAARRVLAGDQYLCEELEQ